MRNTNKSGKGATVFLCAAILAACLYLGYCMGACGKPSGAEWLANVLSRLRNPFPFEVTEWTGRFLGLSALAGGILCLLLISEKHSFEHGREYGTARFATPGEVNRKYRNRKARDNKIVSKNVRISRDRFTKRNNNVLILGGSGAGKTKCIVTPNLLEPENGVNGKVTKVFTDPKGEILRDNANFLMTKGVKIEVLDLINMQGHYNPFRYIRKSIDIIKLVTNLISNTTPKGANKGDPFWEKAESMFLMSLFYYVWMQYPKGQQSFRRVMELIKEAKIPENEDEVTELDEKMYALDENHPARISYEKVRKGAVDTVRSIVISANARLAFLQEEDVLSVLDDDDMNIPELGRGVHFDGKSPTAVFLVIPDNDKTYNFIIGMFYTQLFQELYYQADFECGGGLPVSVEVWFDEFANIALPDDFIQILSTERSRNISSNIIIQFEDQVSALFEKLKNGIKANCDTFIYLGANDEESQKSVSQRLGKYTLEKRSTSNTLGKNVSSSRSDDVLGRELLTPDEVALLGGDDEIVFIRGERPVLDKKYWPFKLPEFKESQRLGIYRYSDSGKEGREMDTYSSNDVAYYERMLKEGEIESLNILKMTPEEVMAIKLQDIPDGEPEPSLDEIRIIMEENRAAITASMEKAEDADAEMAEEEKALADMMAGSKQTGKPQTETASEESSEETLADRIRKNNFSEEQIAEAMTGIEHGLPEEKVLAYFTLDTPPSKMRVLRKLAEASLGIRQETEV